VLFAAGTFPLARDPANVLAYRNGGLADSLGMTAHLFLAFGVLYFPLDAPRLVQDEA
jgi:hypothetical protein